MEYVVNEWLPEYFKSTNKSDREKLSKFLNCFYCNDDVILVKFSSPFLSKLFKFAKELRSGNLEKYKPLKHFINTILLNSNKCKMINEGEYANSVLPENLIFKLNQGNFESDKYLFETAMLITNNEKIIVTTDKRLIKHVQEISSFKLIHLDDFLDKYCNNV